MDAKRQESQGAEREPLLSRRQAAEYLGVSSNTLAVWACTRQYELPYIRVGRLAKYKRADLDAWLASRTVNPESA